MTGRQKPRRWEQGKSQPRRYRIGRRITTKTGAVRWAVYGEHLDIPGEWVLLPSRFRSPEDAHRYIAAVTANQQALLDGVSRESEEEMEVLKDAC